MKFFPILFVFFAGIFRSVFKVLYCDVREPVTFSFCGVSIVGGGFILTEKRTPKKSERKSTRDFPLGIFAHSALLVLHSGR